MNTIKKLIAAGILLVLAFPMVKDDDNTGGSSSSGGSSPPPISPTGWDNILNPQYMRTDSCGAGHYGANRTGGRIHKGVDIVCSEHQAVFAPFTGKITRSFNAYRNGSTFYKGIELSDEQGTKVKILYVYPNYNLVGQYVQRGQQIATCQKISNNYNCSMIDHLHIELWQNGVNADVTPYLNV